MAEVGLAKTVNCGVVGIMNGFIYLADAGRQDEPNPNLLTLAPPLATSPSACPARPCSPLFKRHISPDRELAALAAAGRRQH